MIEQFAGARGIPWSEFLGLKHASKTPILVSLVIPKFAADPRIKHRQTSESGH